MHSVSLKTLQIEGEALAVVWSCKHVYDVCPVCVLVCALCSDAVLNLCSDLAEVWQAEDLPNVRLERNDPVPLLVLSVSFISMNKFS